MTRLVVLTALVFLNACADPALSDADGDGYCGVVDMNGDAITACDGEALPGDCDDTKAEAYPGAPEYCDDIDTDCDGVVDEPDALDANAWYVDFDKDGFGDNARLAKACVEPVGWVLDNTDCDDNDASVGPC